MAQKELDLLCIGNALVDVFARADEQTLARHGITRPVQHVEYEIINKILSELGSKDLVLSSGGGAANVAKIAGFLGAELCFTGSVGEVKEPDTFGRLFIKELSNAGVKLRLSLKPSPTGVCLYVRTGDETRIAASPSAALELTENDIVEEDLQKASVVVIDGFILNRSGMVRRILDLADKYGTVIALDLSSISIASEYAAEISEYARRHSLILFMNEAEAEAFYKETRKDNSLFPEMCEFFESLTAGKRFPIIVVKLGARGALCFAEGKTQRFETQALVPADSTGAGDAFCAAFLSAWVWDKALPECAVFGNKAAGIVLGATGTKVEKEAFGNLVQLLK